MVEEEVEIFTNLPASVDLRPNCPPVYDQLQLEASTPNAVAAAIHILLITNSQTLYTPSRLFIYYGARSTEGDISDNKPVTIPDCINVCTSLGVCTEDTMPYAPLRFVAPPTAAAYTEALTHLVTASSPVAQTAMALQTALYAGHPIIFNFDGYEKFFKDIVDQTGVLKVPEVWEELVQPWSAVIVGYDSGAQIFWVRNSLSDAWGNAGYFTMPYEYVLNPTMARDFWIITAIN